MTQNFTDTGYSFDYSQKWKVY